MKVPIFVGALVGKVMTEEITMGEARRRMRLWYELLTPDEKAALAASRTQVSEMLHLAAEGVAQELMVLSVNVGT